MLQVVKRAQTHSKILSQVITQHPFLLSRPRNFNHQNRRFSLLVHPIKTYSSNKLDNFKIQIINLRNPLGHLKFKIMLLRHKTSKDRSQFWISIQIQRSRFKLSSRIYSCLNKRNHKCRIISKDNAICWTAKISPNSKRISGWRIQIMD